MEESEDDEEGVSGHSESDNDDLSGEDGRSYLESNSEEVSSGDNCDDDISDNRSEPASQDSSIPIGSRRASETASDEEGTDNDSDDASDTDSFDSENGRFFSVYSFETETNSLNMRDADPGDTFSTRSAEADDQSDEHWVFSNATRAFTSIHWRGL